MPERLTLLSLLPLLEYTPPDVADKALYDAATAAVHPLQYRVPRWRERDAFAKWQAAIMKAGTELHACLPDTTPQVYVATLYHQLRRVSRAGNQYLAQCRRSGCVDSIAVDWGEDMYRHARTLLLDAHTAIHAGILHRPPVKPEQHSGPDGSYRCAHNGTGLFPCDICADSR